MLRIVTVITGRIAALAVCLLAGTVLLATPATAHDVLVKSDPAAGAALSTAPTAVVLSFAEQALRTGTRVQVTGPGGTVVSTAPVEVVGSTVTQPLDAGLSPGAYTVVWRVASADGHPVSGRFGFTLTAAAAGTSTSPAPSGSTSPSASETASPSPSGTVPASSSAGAVPEPTTSSSGGVPLPLVIAGVLVVLAGLGALMWRLARRPTADR